MKVTKEQVAAALASIDKSLASGGDISKASADDLDEPEGADLGNPAKDKMSAAAAKKAKSEMPEMKKGKDDKEEKEEGDDAEGDDEGEEKEEKKNPFEKKMKKSFNEDLPKEIETKVDVSDFLKSLVDHTAEAVDGLRDHVLKSDRNTHARYDNLADAVGEVQKSQAMLGVVLKAICERMGVIESAPARAPKSETVAKSGAATDRSFSSGLAVEPAEGKMFKSLSNNPIEAKSQIANAILEMVKKGEATDLDLIGFESGGYVSPTIGAKLSKSLN